MSEKISEKVSQLLYAEYCCDELKEACQHWLDANGTTKESDATSALIAEIKEDILTIGEVISLCKEHKEDWFDTMEEADDYIRHAEEVKASGATYCDCEACTVARELLEMIV